jgi:hypothetical protein
MSVHTIGRFGQHIPGSATVRPADAGLPSVTGSVRTLSGWANAETESLVKALRAQGIALEMFADQDKFERFCAIKFGPQLRLDRVDFGDIWANRLSDMCRPL